MTGIGAVIMLVLFREFRINAWAVNHSDQVSVRALKVWVDGEVWDIGVLTTKVFCLFFAGVLAWFGFTAGAIFLIVMSAMLLVALGFAKLFRWWRIMRLVELDQPGEAIGS